ncbi:MAG: hypothetical protein ACR2MW_01790 [Chthoniobacterales bacterium]
MKKVLCSAFLALVLSFLLPSASGADATSLAQEVAKASGSENWGHVQTIDFAFVVEKEGKQVAKAEHHWDVAAGTDEIKWKGKEVKVDLANPGTSKDEKAAYARWVNDSYWLLAPLKLQDKGVTTEAEGTKEMNGKKCEVLKLSFVQVGLTPSDQYRLYVDPQSQLVTYWDYLPKGEKGMSGTWEDYQKSGGLTLATDHKMGGGIRIRIEGLKVTAK